MSGECDDCGEHALECYCKRTCNGKYFLKCICGLGCPCKFKEHYTHLNLVRNDMKASPKGGADPPIQSPEIKWINVRGRAEHEAIIKNATWCRELRLDQDYEIMVYLKRWGSWLGE
jgi:hypothetical protein